MKILSHLPRNARCLTLCGALFAFALGPQAFAQVPSSATTTADPSRAQQQFLGESETPNVSQRRVEVKDLVLQEVPAGAENINLQLNSLNLEGVTAYDLNELAAVYADKIGTQITLVDVYAISTALTNKYRNDGYVLTQVVVPPQTIDGGNVTLRVVEGFVDRIAVEGDTEDGGLDLIRYYASGINTDQALNVKDLERHLLLINDLPGVSARSVLSPSKTQTGAADLAIIVERDPYDVFLSADNYGSRYLGPLQFGVGGSVNSFFGNNERITAQIVAAPDPGTDAPAELELGYFALSYAQPLSFLGAGTEIELLASHTDTEPGHDLKEFDIEGISRFISAKISHPFVRSRSSNFTGYALLDWRNVESRSNIQATLRDNIRAARVGANYEFLDTVFGVGVNSWGVQLSQGLDILGASQEGDSNMTRGSGDPQFTKMTADIQRLQRVTSDVNLLVAATGQMSSGPLLSSEEFGVGGVGFGRGFDSSEIVGDEGMAGKVEIQWNEPRKIDFLDDYQLFAFVDAGRVWNDDATTSAQKADTATSTGFGVRTEFLGGIEGDLFVGIPLNRQVQAQGDDDPRLFFSVRHSF